MVLVLHEEASTPISTAMESVRLPAPGEAPLALAVVVGPEGGISPEETAALEAVGATTVRLGPPRHAHRLSRPSRPGRPRPRQRPVGVR